jgi:endonuclease/exonuclease/phosphatase family metal-dependent hydrolase
MLFRRTNVDMETAGIAMLPKLVPDLRSGPIDYIFIPHEWVSRLQMVDVGEYERWPELSDHCPVTVVMMYLNR